MAILILPENTYILLNLNSKQFSGENFKVDDSKMWVWSPENYIETP